MFQHGKSVSITLSMGIVRDLFHPICVSYRSQITGSDGVSFLLPQLFFSQHRLEREKVPNLRLVQCGNGNERIDRKLQRSSFRIKL